MAERRGNYEIQRDYARGVFLKYDQEIIIKKLGLRHDAQYLYVRFVEREYRIERETGIIEYAWDTEHSESLKKIENSHIVERRVEKSIEKSNFVKQCSRNKSQAFDLEAEFEQEYKRTAKLANFEEALSIYDLLCYSQEAPKPCGVWAPINSVRHTPRAIGVQPNFSSVQAKYFDAQAEKFREACVQLGARQIDIGDIGFEIPVFEGVSVRLKFYVSDDEFPAQLLMLWDMDILKYMRYETTFYVMGHIYSRLMELMKA